MSHVNNFIIGLGGTGGRSIAAFRRAAKLRALELNRLGAETGVRYRYLYIDSSSVDVNAARENTGVEEEDAQDENLEASGDWFVANESVRLSNHEVLDLKANGLNMNAAYQLSNIDPWIGGTKIMDEDARARAQIIGAGQRRRYGRVLFASNAAQVNERLTRGIQALISENVHAADGITFHIFATVGGGTGSGSIVDTITLAQRICADSNYEACFYLYLYVGGPDPNVRESVAGFFYGNEYATLRDINGLMTGRYHPFMAGLQMPAENERFQLPNAIKCVFLSSEDSPSHRGLKDQVENMANACFDSISLLLSGNNGGMVHSITGEDLKSNYPGEIRKKLHNDRLVNHSPDTTGNELPERSYNYQGITVVHLRHPSDEISAVFKSSYALEVYDRWLKGSIADRKKREEGSTSYQLNRELFSFEAPENSAYAAELAKYSDEVLGEFCRAKAKEDNENAEYREELLEDINARVLERLREIEQRARRHIDSDSNGTPDPLARAAKGVVEELDVRLTALVNRLRRWTADGVTWGLMDVQNYLRTMRDALEQERNTASSLNKDLGNMPARSREWKKVGVLTEAVTTVAEKLFLTHYQEAYAVLNRAMTWYRGEVERILKRHLIQKIEKILEHLTTLIRDINQQITQEKDLKKSNLERLSSVNEQVYSYVYNKERLTRHVANIENPVDPDAAYTPRMIEIEDVWRRNFERGIVPYTKERFRDVVKILNARNEETSFWKLSLAMHDRAAEDRPDSYAPVLHDSIYEALKDAGNSSIDDVVGRIQLPITLMEVGTPGGPGLIVGTGDRVSPAKAVAVGLPPLRVTDADAEAQEDMRNFKRQVEKSLKQRLEALGSLDSYVHKDPYEIRVMYSSYWMPARFASVVRYVQKQYETIYKQQDSGPRRSFLYFTSLDDEGMVIGNESRPPLIQENLLTELCEGNEKRSQ